jgi:hypothetical protein
MLMLAAMLLASLMIAGFVLRVVVTFPRQPMEAEG